MWKEAGSSIKIDFILSLCSSVMSILRLHTIMLNLHKEDNSRKLAWSIKSLTAAHRLADLAGPVHWLRVESGRPTVQYCRVYRPGSRRLQRASDQSR